MWDHRSLEWFSQSNFGRGKRDVKRRGRRRKMRGKWRDAWVKHREKCVTVTCCVSLPLFVLTVPLTMQWRGNGSPCVETFSPTTRSNWFPQLLAVAVIPVHLISSLGRLGYVGLRPTCPWHPSLLIRTRLCHRLTAVPVGELRYSI